MPIRPLRHHVVRQAWRLVPQRALSEVIGWGSKCPVPGPLRTSFIGGFARRYGIDVDEAEKPLSGYRDVAEFFTRKLRPGARQLDPDPGAVLSPADGTVVSCGRVDSGMLFEAKGSCFSLHALLAGASDAAAFEGGSYLITYLSPRDYHRVHSPLSGEVVRWAHVPGELFPVNDASVRREPGLFARNERFVTWLATDVGLCAVVMVAAIGVGHITASYDPAVATHSHGFAAGEVRTRSFAPGPRLQRGDELGTFHLGSTTILLFAPGAVELKPFAPGQTMRMGQSIGQLAPAPRRGNS